MSTSRMTTAWLVATAAVGAAFACTPDASPPPREARAQPVASSASPVSTSAGPPTVRDAGGARPPRITAERCEEDIPEQSCVPGCAAEHGQCGFGCQETCKTCITACGDSDDTCAAQCTKTKDRCVTGDCGRANTACEEALSAEAKRNYGCRAALRTSCEKLVACTDRCAPDAAMFGLPYLDEKGERCRVTCLASLGCSMAFFWSVFYKAGSCESFGTTKP